MKNLKGASDQYFEILKERSKKSKAYKPYQLAGLTIAEILNDNSHKSLYIKLAKSYDQDELVRMAKTISEGKDIKNKGAYFMSVLKASNLKKIK